MKKYNIIYLFIALLIVTSCSDEFLTKLPETVVSADDFYQTESDYSQAIIGVYQCLRPLYNTGLAGYGAWTMGEMRSDNTTFSYNQSNRGYADREYVDLFTDDSNSGSTSNKYNNDYIIIGRANQLLSRIDAADLSDDVRSNYKGQALFLRAFAYFDLVQYYGDVPLVVNPPTCYDETLKPRDAKSEVYNQIIADAKLAAELLPAKAKQAKGYVANGAAYTLLGNVYVVLNEWAKAEEVLLKVNGYSLLNDYASIFSPDNKNNDEMIFEIQFTDDESAGAASNFAYNFLPILTNPGVIEGFPNGNTNNYAGWNTPTPDLIDAYDKGDLRLDASIGYYTGEKYENRPYVKKYVHGAKIAPNANDDFPVYRYSEVLLFLAESLNEQGKSNEALTYLNQVHAHSRTGLNALTISDQTNLREAILHERQIELAFENKRWLDLVRSGKAIEVMNAQGVKIKTNPQKYYYPEGVGPKDISYNVTAERLLFPIPEREIRLNPEMEQNSGY